MIHISTSFALLVVAIIILVCIAGSRLSGRLGVPTLFIFIMLAYGDRNGSRKYLTASLDQSLKRMGLEYVDIFYHHVRDPETPLEETALALDNAVRQGKALYVGISNYNRADTAEMLKIFRELRTPFIVNQPSYSILNRWIEDDKLDSLALSEGFGDRKSTRLNSSHIPLSRMPSSA